MASALGSYVTSTLLKARAGIPDAEDDALLDDICEEVNSWIEAFTGRVLAPISNDTMLFDGADTEQFGARLYVPRGIRTLTTLETATETGGSYTSRTLTDFLLRPHSHEQPNGWPPIYLLVKESATRLPQSGYDTIRITAATGFAAVPDDVRGAALAIAVRSWHGRQSGQADLVGVNESGQPVVSRYVSVEDKRTLERYILPRVA